MVLFSLIDVAYYMKKAGLDYEEEFEVLLELDEELKDYYVSNNIPDEPNKRRKERNIKRLSRT